MSKTKEKYDTRRKKPLLQELIEFLSIWEKAETKPKLNFFEREQYSLSEIIEVLESGYVASGTGMCINLSILEQKMKGKKVIDDRENKNDPIFFHHSKQKLYNQALLKQKNKKNLLKKQVLFILLNIILFCSKIWHTSINN